MLFETVGRRSRPIFELCIRGEEAWLGQIVGEPHLDGLDDRRVRAKILDSCVERWKHDVEISKLHCHATHHHIVDYQSITIETNDTMSALFGLLGCDCVRANRSHEGSG